MMPKDIRKNEITEDLYQREIEKPIIEKIIKKFEEIANNCGQNGKCKIHIYASYCSYGQKDPKIKITIEKIEPSTKIPKITVNVKEEQPKLNDCYKTKNDYLENCKELKCEFCKYFKKIEATAYVNIGNLSYIIIF